jgi:Fe-S cluster assembly ATP-binding protein
MLVIDKLSVRRADKDILNSVSFIVAPGELLSLVGPNGSGKSTLALTLFGHSSCLVTQGSLSLDEQDLLPLKTFARAKLGLFLAHQEPPAIAGVTVATALRAMSDALRTPSLSTPEFFSLLRLGLQELELPDSFADRYLHEALSGGEKKRLELLTLVMLSPKYAVLDEIDSGMDAEARRLTAAVVSRLRQQGTGFVVISHNQEFLDSLRVSRRLTLSQA